MTPVIVFYIHMQPCACRSATMMVAVLLQDSVTAFNTIVDLNVNNVSFI